MLEDKLEIRKTDSLLEGGESIKGLSESALSGPSVAPIIDIKRPEQTTKAEDNDQGKIAHVRKEVAIHEDREDTLVANKTETSEYGKTIHDEYHESEQQRKVLKSRLSRALMKLGKGTHDFILGSEIEPNPDYFSQEQLLKLVQKAEAEIAERKEKEYQMLYPLAEESGINIDIGILEQNVAQINEDIEKNETNFSSFIEQENKGEKVEKREYIALWRERGELTDNLYYVEKQQKAYTQKMAEKAQKSLILHLLAPVHRLVLKGWISLNRPNPMDSTLWKLRRGYNHLRAKEKVQQPEVGGKFKRKLSSTLEALRVERASPAMLAAEITRMQNEPAKN